MNLQNILAIMGIALFVISIVRDGEVESCAFSVRALGPDSPSVSVKDAVNRCKSNSGAGKIRVAVQPLEWTKELVGIVHQRSP